jgi:hypothetical protein
VLAWYLNIFSAFKVYCLLFGSIYLCLCLLFSFLAWKKSQSRAARVRVSCHSDHLVITRLLLLLSALSFIWYSSAIWSLALVLVKLALVLCCVYIFADCKSLFFVCLVIGWTIFIGRSDGVVWGVKSWHRAISVWEAWDLSRAWFARVRLILKVRFGGPHFLYNR